MSELSLEKTRISDKSQTDQWMQSLRAAAENAISPDRDAILGVYLDKDIPTSELLALGEITRERFFQKSVQIHILNNVKNGNCSEDCSYCAQRKGDVGEEIPSYSMKDEEEILREAQDAYRAGAYRYCLVLSGKGPSVSSIDFFGRVVRRLKVEYPGMEICLSAGILTNPEQAEALKEAGLDRYNHNLNTSMAHYDDICTTHQFSDRVDTLTTMSGAGVSLCSGVIVGMGESASDLVEVAFQLRANRVSSIPVNFFMPVPGHKIQGEGLTADRCLRILSIFRLINPDAELRMAAGRELYLGDLQGEGLRVANSLFVSGYLNVKGSNLQETLEMIHSAGYSVDLKRSDLPRGTSGNEMQDATQSAEGGEVPPDAASTPTFRMKGVEDLRPYR